MTPTDLDLLRDFARDQSQDAFTALVRRHLGLVYSAAFRQVRSPQLAEEVAQSVFTDLARSAARLKSDTILTAWLYRVTHRTAVDVVRREARRQSREQAAFEMNANAAADADWTQVEPLLDEAMHALDDTDRTAVLLRYFENKSLREVGNALGTTDEAARKRISRAVERLREFFFNRGVTTGASGLAIVISSHAVQSAPSGLTATVSVGALSAGTASLLTSTTAIVMKILNGKLAASIITVFLLAGGAYVVWHQQVRAGKNEHDAAAPQASATNEVLYAEMLAAYPVASEVLDGHPTRELWQELRMALLNSGYIETRRIPFAQLTTGRMNARTFFDRFRQRFGAVEIVVSGFTAEVSPVATVTARKIDLGPAGAIEQFIRSYEPDQP